MRYLHTMIRVSDPDATVRFFQLLGLEERRRMENEAGRFTLIFLGVPGDDGTVAFKNGRTVYVNHLLGECNGLKSGFYTLVTRSSGSGLCRGDIARVADVSTGMIVGSCAVGDFIPYTTGG